MQRRRPLPAAETGRSCWGRILIFQSPAKGLRKNQQMQPVRPRRFPTRRNVYRDAGTVWGFFVVDGTGLEQQRRRPLPAAETGRSCWGRILIFQSPAKGLRKNQQMQPVRPRRFPTRRNVYRDAGTVWGFFCGGRYRTRTGRLCGFRFANFTLSEMFFP